MATQNVTVTVTGIQKQIVSRKGDLYVVSAQEDRTEITVPGTYSCVNGKHYVIYEEDLGEGYVTGNTVKIYDGGFEVIKKGAVGAHMYFKAGQRDEGWYDTPYGRFAMVIDVKTVEITEKKAQGNDRGSLRVEANYVMWLNGEPTSKNRICIVAEGIFQ